MTRLRPDPDCRDLALRGSYLLDDGGEVAFEDYARVLTRARSAEARRAGADPFRVTGVHLCGPAAAATPAVLDDLEGFVRDLEARGPAGGGGLGWS